MARNYHQLLPYAFKRFSIISARKTFVPTIRHYLTRTPLPPSPKPALFTMNILPPLMTVWYHFVQKNLGDKVDTVIFDCSGKLNPKEFPKARVQKYLNLYAATKTEEFLRHIARNRTIGWACDDDMFIMDPKALNIVERELAVPNTVSVSFRPRSWWHFEIGGKEYEPSSSYCIAFNRNILIKKEGLSLAPCHGNTHPSHIGKENRRYDTFDKANEVLLIKKYRCFIVSEEEREKYVTGYSGIAGAVMLLYYFKKPEQVIDYFLSPLKKKWRGNVLFGVLNSMLAIASIQEIYEKLTGKRYSLPSLPQKSELMNIRENHKNLIRDDQSFETFDKVSERLFSAL